ncbi:large ribosomal subunit protein bL35m-like [Antedon mediterranea]|uniref:large ribosomal subunit protein bL35m-like n=1 Tax=Antedon mediterranea TaxID=105859 RepID=UPI003AF5238A
MFRTALLRLASRRGVSRKTPILQQPLQNCSPPLYKVLPDNVVSNHVIPESLKRSFSTFLTKSYVTRPIVTAGMFLNERNANVPHLLRVTASTNDQPSRMVVRCSMNKGKKKTVKAVISRFYRFSNGLWLRRYAGYKKKLFKKSLNRKKRIKNHIFCSRTQSKMLDLMVTRYWRERKYYVDHPYDKYQERNFNGFKTWPGEKIAHANYERVGKHGYRMKD